MTIDNNTISMTVKQHKDVKTPFISVVVPTRNRAELLTQSALPTVLQQTFEDFELVNYNHYPVIKFPVAV